MRAQRCSLAGVFLGTKGWVGGLAQPLPFEVPPWLLAKLRVSRTKAKSEHGALLTQTVGLQWEQAAGGAVGCVGQLCLHRGAQSVSEFQSLKLYQEKVLSVVSLNICSSANKGIKSSLQIHNLEIKGNN